MNKLNNGMPQLWNESKDQVLHQTCINFPAIYDHQCSFHFNRKTDDACSNLERVTGRTNGLEIEEQCITKLLTIQLKLW